LFETVEYKKILKTPVCSSLLCQIVTEAKKHIIKICAKYIQIEMLFDKTTFASKRINL